MAENISLQQEKIYEIAINSSEVISEVSLMGAALALEEMNVLGRTESNDIVLTSIENIGNQSARLEVILTAINDRHAPQHQR